MRYPISPYTRLPSNLGLKRVTFFCLKGFIREPKPPKKGIRELLGILVYIPFKGCSFPHSLPANSKSLLLRCLRLGETEVGTSHGDLNNRVRIDGWLLM